MPDERGDCSGAQGEGDVVDHGDTGPVGEADAVELDGACVTGWRGVAFTGVEFGLVEDDTDTTGSEHAAAQATETVPEAEKASSERGPQEQERQQSCGLHASGRDQSGPGDSDEKQESGGSRREIDERLLVAEGALPTVEELDVFT